MTSHNKKKKKKTHESSFHFYKMLNIFFLLYLNMNIFLDFRASGICKHVGGLLWYIKQEFRLGNNLTCTSQPHKWHQPSKKTTEKTCTCIIKSYCYQKANLPSNSSRKRRKKILSINL